LNLNPVLLLKLQLLVAAGALEGMGLGMNATAMLVTRGCKEMQKVGKAMGADDATLNDLSGN
jgi:glycerol-3-phosphate dehydrogenase